MHKFFTPKELINDNKAKIIGEDVKHIYKVLRLTEGEEVVLNNCEGVEYLANNKYCRKAGSYIKYN